MGNDVKVGDVVRYTGSFLNEEGWHEAIVIRTHDLGVMVPC